MYPGLPSRLEKEMKQLYLTRVLNGDASRLKVQRVIFSVCRLAKSPYHAEFQNPNRGPPSAKTHGIPWWSCARGYHEGQRGVLGIPGGLV